ncbi:MAG: hypothetical protein AAFN12_13925, partial [Cyanobacteria bacterium J06560_2]
MVSPLAKDSEKGKKTWQVWGAIAAILLAIVATLLLTRPAANVMSMTPISGLMALKASAAEAMPYEAALANQKPTLIEFY